MSISFKELISQTQEVISKFENIEGKKWGAEGAMIELSKQVGELSEAVMKAEKYYPDSKQGSYSNDKIADELSDILFIVIRLAKHYNIDLEKSHLEQLEAAKNFIDKE